MSKINKVKCQMSKINKVNFDGAYLRSSSGHFCFPSAAEFLVILAVVYIVAIAALMGPSLPRLSPQACLHWHVGLLCW